MLSCSLPSCQWEAINTYIYVSDVKDVYLIYRRELASPGYKICIRKKFLTDYKEDDSLQPSLI